MSVNVFVIAHRIPFGHRSFTISIRFILLLSNKVLTLQQAIRVRVFIAKVVRVDVIRFCAISDSLIL
jgi:hypothetical protein